jgi:hypothetical protein
MDNSQDLNKDAASFESKEPSSSIFGFQIEESSDQKEEQSLAADSSITTSTGLTEQQNMYLA